MKSRISIEVDYDNGREPVIQILSRDSDDLRDGLIKSFLQSFGAESNRCSIEWLHHGEDFKRIYIRAIPPEKINK